MPYRCHYKNKKQIKNVIFYCSNQISNEKKKTDLHSLLFDNEWSVLNLMSKKSTYSFSPFFLFLYLHANCFFVWHTIRIYSILSLFSLTMWVISNPQLQSFHTLEICKHILNSFFTDCYFWLHEAHLQYII
jgi:hypothetical protein